MLHRLSSIGLPVLYRSSRGYIWPCASETQAIFCASAEPWWGWGRFVMLHDLTRWSCLAKVSSQCSHWSMTGNQQSVNVDLTYREPFWTWFMWVAIFSQVLPIVEVQYMHLTAVISITFQCQKIHLKGIVNPKLFLKKLFFLNHLLTLITLKNKSKKNPL